MSFITSFKTKKMGNLGKTSCVCQINLNYIYKNPVLH